jgi:predicted ATPase
MFPFKELCGQPVAAADYIALSNAFHTLVLKGVPAFSSANRTEAYRFLTLVDVLYEHNIRLFCSAEALPFELFEHIITRTQSSTQVTYITESILGIQTRGFVGLYASSLRLFKLSESQMKQK